MGKRHTVPKTSTESYLNLHVVPPGYQPKGGDDCRYLAHYDEAYSGFVELIGLARLST